MNRLAALLLLIALAACGESMDRQNRLKTYGVADGIPDWPGPGEALAPPAGTVSRADAARDAALATPPPVNAALLARGRQRYDIYCAPCHGLTGDGGGFVVARGFPRPRPFSDPRLMKAGARQMLDVIGNGRGAMYGFSDRVDPADRWAIIAYIRALQLAARGARP
jgi:mono/diheme cytochrome c family protein